MASARVQGTRPEAAVLHCPNCGRRLAPCYGVEWRREEVSGGFVSRPWYSGEIWRYGADGVFCKNACAQRFARRCVAAGVVLEGYDEAAIEARQRRKNGASRR